MFCFKLSDCGNSRPDVAVWFYDHGLCTINKISDSFSAWLEEFNGL